MKAEAARQSTPQPLFNLTTVLPGIRFNNTGLREILNSIGMTSGVNVTYDNTFQDRTYTVQLDNVTLEEALNQILAANQLFYKVISPRSIIVVPDNVQKRGQYEEQAIRTFPMSHADATELAQLINTIIRVGGGQVQPMVVANKTANTVTVRATTNVLAIIERIVEQNDNPRAEVVVDVQILEVNRSRTKQFGLDLGDYSVTAVFSPEADPRGTTATAATARPAPRSTSRPFNANTVSRGINTTDFYLAVPSAVVRFLESDSESKMIAKPQLRGAEGQKLTLNLGEEVPIPSTTFTPVAQGGAAFNPLTSFTYRPVGVNVEITPRVTFEGDIILELLIENSALGEGLNVAGQNLPSFTSRKVVTKLRLRDGESNLLAGLLQEEERRSLRGFPGILRLPIIKQLFSANDNTIGQTDIVMLLTPRIVRTHELTARDLTPDLHRHTAEPGPVGPAVAARPGSCCCPGGRAGARAARPRWCAGASRPGPGSATPTVSSTRERSASCSTSSASTRLGPRARRRNSSRRRFMTAWRRYACSAPGCRGSKFSNRLNVWRRASWTRSSVSARSRAHRGSRPRAKRWSGLRWRVNRRSMATWSPWRARARRSTVDSTGPPGADESGPPRVLPSDMVGFAHSSSPVRFRGVATLPLVGGSRHALRWKRQTVCPNSSVGGAPGLPECYECRGPDRSSVAALRRSPCRVDDAGWVNLSGDPLGLGQLPDPRLADSSLRATSTPTVTLITSFNIKETADSPSG